MPIITNTRTWREQMRHCCECLTWGRSAWCDCCCLYRRHCLQVGTRGERPVPRGPFPKALSKSPAFPRHLLSRCIPRSVFVAVGDCAWSASAMATNGGTIESLHQGQMADCTLRQVPRCSYLGDTTLNLFENTTAYLQGPCANLISHDSRAGGWLLPL